MTIDDGARLGGASPVEAETVDDVLRSPSAGGKVIRGGALRAVGYGAAVVVGTATAALLLRHLGVDDFGRYVTVTALLGIVAALTDSGLTAVGNREMATRKAGWERDHLLANLLVVRVAATVVGVLGAVAFALVVGYPESMVAGTLVGGIGILLLNAQTMMTMPMWVDLRIGSIVVLDFLKQVLTLVFVALLVALGAGLFPFYAVQIPVGIALILVTVLVLRRVDVLVPRLDVPTARMLVRETLPLAIAFTMSIVYFRVLVILVSLVSTPEQTGLYGTSFRIFETLLAAPALVLGVALPLLSVAGVEDEPRFRYAIQRMTETALLAGGLLVIAIGVLAEPAIRIIGGPSYRRRGTGSPGTGRRAPIRLPRSDVAARVGCGARAADHGYLQRAGPRRRHRSRPDPHPAARGPRRGMGCGHRRGGSHSDPLDRPAGGSTRCRTRPQAELEDAGRAGRRHRRRSPRPSTSGRRSAPRVRRVRCRRVRAARRSL